MAIRVDANQGWNPKEAVRIIRRLEDLSLNIDLVEQPVGAHDLAGMQYVTQNTYTPILADESVFCAEDAIRIIQMGAADLINIKLMKTGGIYEALKIAGIAEIYGVECMMGCMLESKIAVSAAAHPVSYTHLDAAKPGSPDSAVRPRRSGGDAGWILVHGLPLRTQIHRGRRRTQEHPGPGDGSRSCLLDAGRLAHCQSIGRPLRPTDRPGASGTGRARLS